MFLAKALSIIIAIAAVVMGAAAMANSITMGQASVIDGDTIDIRGKRFRLFGVDAPESSQLCTTSGKAWRCGQQSALALSDFIGSANIACRARGKSYERIVAVCFKGIEDLGRHQVEQGWAVAATKYSRDYVGPEAVARAKLKGIWLSTFDYPWVWRSTNKRGHTDEGTE